MSRGNVYAAIDIGTSKITTVLVSEDEEAQKMRVVGVSTQESRGIRKSQVVDIEEAVDAITSSVEAAERMAGFSITNAYVSLSGHHIASQNSKGVVAVSHSGDEIVEDDVARVIEAARAISLPSSREILHVIPRDFIVDGQGGIKDPLSMGGVRLEVDAHIITGATTAVRNLSKCVTELGITVQGMVFSGLAAARATLTETEKELGVCLIDIGGGTTSVCVYVEGALSYSGVLPVGAKHVTNDLAIGLRVSLEQAEQIKLLLSNQDKEALLQNPKENSDLMDLEKHGVAADIKKPSYKTMVDGIVRPRLNEIFGMVAEELKRVGLVATTPAGVVLAGGGALTVCATDACKRTLSMPVRLARVDGEQKTKRKLSGLTDDIGDARFAVVQGLILHAASEQTRSYSTRAPLPQMGDIIHRFSGKGMAGKLIDFVRSFLP